MPKQALEFDQIERLRQAVTRGEIGRVAALIAGCDLNIDVGDDTLLEHLINDCQDDLPETAWDALALLIEAGCDPNRRGAGGTLPLMAAIYSEKLQTVKWLVEHGAQPDLETEPGSGETHLDLAESDLAASRCTFDPERQPGIVQYLKSVGARAHLGSEIEA